MQDLREWSFQSSGLSTKHRPRTHSRNKGNVRCATLAVAFPLLDTPASGATLGDTG
jgi:hypothetical protein